MRRRVKYSDKAFEAGVHPDNLKYRRMHGSALGFARDMPNAFRVKWAGRKTVEILHRDFIEPDPSRKEAKAPARIRLRFRKNDPAHNLQAAAQAWLIANGGDAVVIGRIGIMREPDAFRFQICIGVTGMPPTKIKPKETGEG